MGKKKNDSTEKKKKETRGVGSLIYPKDHEQPLVQFEPGTGRPIYREQL